MEDVTLAAELLLDASTVAQLGNRNIKHAQPDKVERNEGNRRESNDNLQESN